MFVGIVCSLTAMAADVTVKWDYACVSEKTSDDVTLTSGGLNLTVVNNAGGSSDYVNNAATEFLHWNGKSSSTIRYAKFTAPQNGTITVKFKSNNTSATDRIVAVGKAVVTGSDVATLLENSKVYAADYTNGSNVITINGSVTAGDVYIYNANGGCNISEITYKYTTGTSTATPSFTTDLSTSTYNAVVSKTLALSVVTADATGVQWYSCEDAEGTNPTKIDGATNPTHNFTPTAGDANTTKYFYCVATNDNATGEKNATSKIASVFVKELYAITFSKGDDANIIGTAPALIETNEALKVTIPANYSLSVDGKTLVAWTDGVNEYQPNTEYTLSSNVTVTPVFEANVKTLNDVRDETTVQFIKSTSTAATYQSSEKNAVVEQVDINGQKTDVALIIQNGKFDLQPASSRAQTNQNTKISIPVTKGAVVVIDIYDNKADGERTYTATINDESVEPYLGAENGKQRIMTYTYNGEADYIDYVVGAGSMYAYSINVTYPNQSGISTKPTVTFSMKTAASGNVSVGANADHEAIPAAANLTTKGGSVTVSNGQSSAKNLVTNRGFSMTNGNTFFTVTLDAPLKAGDVITATMSESARGLKFATTDGYSADYPGEAAETTAFSYTVTEEDGICGETTFNVFRATSNSTYFNDFKITRPATIAEPTLNAAGFTTFSSAYPVKIYGAKVYVATLDAEGGKIVATQVETGEVPAGTGVILVGEAGATATASYCADAADINTLNHLAATTLADGSLAEKEDALVLSGSTFKTYTGAAFAAGKAYFPYTASGSAKTAFSIVFDDDDATAADVIEAQPVKAATPVKYINARGQLIIKGFNALGQQVK